MESKAQAVKATLIPEKSAQRYETIFEQFVQWKVVNRISDDDFSQDTLLVYFNELSTRLAASTLWNYYSAIKKILKVRKEVSIKHYENLKDFLKMKGGDHTPKKSNVSTQRFWIYS